MRDWVARVLTRLGQLWCRHDMLLERDAAGPYLQCLKCGRRTHGWLRVK